MVNNDPDEICYAYVYIHKVFLAIAETNRKLWRYDEVRTSDYEDTEHELFKGVAEGCLIEMPITTNDVHNITWELRSLGIPYLVDTTYTSEYSVFQCYLLNNKITTTKWFTSMDQLDPNVDLSDNLVDVAFFQEFSKLRFSHISVISPSNAPYSIEESLDAYNTYITG